MYLLFSLYVCGCVTVLQVVFIVVLRNCVVALCYGSMLFLLLRSSYRAPLLCLTSVVVLCF